jgi:two-component system CheB/CheR fusion protein
LHIEIWDTGSGIPETQLGAIFEEYQQFENAAPQRSRGAGLGLSNVRRLGALLKHRTSVRSIPGKGSVFAVEVKLATASTISPQKYLPLRVEGVAIEPDRSAGLILIVKGESSERELLGALLKREDYSVATASDSVAAMDLITRAQIQPDLIVVDDDLPNGPSGREVRRSIGELLNQKIPTIVLTNGISPTTLGNASPRHHVQLRKTVRPEEMIDAVRRLLSARVAPGSPLLRLTTEPSRQSPPKIFVIVHDDETRDELVSVFEDDIATVQAYATAESFLEAYRPGRHACLVIDAFLPRMSGLELMRRLDESGRDHPAIIISDRGDVATAVQAIKAGAWDIVEKPIVRRDLIASVQRALGHSSDWNKQAASRMAAVKHFASLTLREREIMKKILAGVPNKNIAADLCISQRTVENHRASVMKKTGSTSLPVLARLALAAEWIGADEGSSRPLSRQITEATDDVAGDMNGSESNSRVIARR